MSKTSEPRDPRYVAAEAAYLERKALRGGRSIPEMREYRRKAATRTHHKDRFRWRTKSSPTGRPVDAYRK